MAGTSNGCLNSPPGPKGQAFRNLLKRVRDTTRLFVSLNRDYGSIVGFHILSKQFCAIFDPTMIEEVVVRKRDFFHKGTGLKKVMGNPCILTADGEDHQRRRKLVQPSFSPKALRGYAEQMVSEAFHRQDAWRDGQTIDIDYEAHDLSLSIAMRTFFGGDIDVSPQLISDSLGGYDWLVRFGLLPFSKFFRALPLPRTIQARRGIQRLDDVIYEAIRRARENSQRSDLIAHLVNARDEDGVHSPYTEDELKAEVFAILIAAHETTAATLTWCIYHLSQNPEARKRMEQEIDSVLGDSLPNFEDYDRLIYTKAVVDESLRLTPPMPYLVRTAVQDVEIGDYCISKGTIVQPSIRIPMRQEKYFADPEQFIPERWLEDPQLECPRFAYAPFGGGARFCSGFRFALMELVFSLAIFCKRWRFNLVSKDFPAVSDLVVYKVKGGLPITLNRR